MPSQEQSLPTFLSDLESIQREAEDVVVFCNKELDREDIPIWRRNEITEKRIRAEEAIRILRWVAERAVIRGL